MFEDDFYKVARVLAKACAVAAAATAPPLWLFSQLTSYQFLFSAPTTMNSFGNFINVCAFTGYLLAAAAIPTYMLYGYAIGTESWIGGGLLTLWIISIAMVHFYHGVMGFGRPNTTSRTIGALLLLPVLIRWVAPVRRFFRVHPILFVPFAYVIGITLVVLGAFAYAAPMDLPVHFTGGLGHPETVYIQVKSDEYPFYTAKNFLEFGIWDWLAAVGGALVYLAVVIIWRNLLKPSTAGPNTD